jgi:hypothetical protein
MRNRLYRVWFIIFLGSLVTAEAQVGPWTKRIQVGLSPGLQHRVITQINPSEFQSHNEQLLGDSFSQNDHFRQGFGAFAGMVFQRQRDVAYGVNVHYQEMGFIRRKEGGMFGYQPHPDLKVYSQLVDGPKQILDYHFLQRFLSFEFSYMRRIDGVNFSLDKTELYAWASVSPAINVVDKVQIRTRGFSLEEGSEVEVYDYKEVPNAGGGMRIQRIENPGFSVFLSAGLRAEYALDETIKIAAQPRFDVSAMPNFQGVQRAHSYRMALDIGFVYLLP